MAARTGLASLVLGTLAAAAAYFSAFLPGDPPLWGALAMVLGIALMSVGSMALGAARAGRRLGRLAWALAVTFVILLLCFGLALVLPGGGDRGAALWAGLPRRAALVLYGVGVLPALFLPLAYALTFREQTLDAGDIERIRAARTGQTL
jgi:O-antigen/teichoic acid export membrane protein